MIFLVWDKLIISNCESGTHQEMQYTLYTTSNLAQMQRVFSVYSRNHVYDNCTPPCQPHHSQISVSSMVARLPWLTICHWWYCVATVQISAIFSWQQTMISTPKIQREDDIWPSSRTAVLSANEDSSARQNIKHHDGRPHSVFSSNLVLPSVTSDTVTAGVTVVAWIRIVL